MEMGCIVLFVFSRAAAHVAQSVEHVLGKDEVGRSIRLVGSTLRWAERGDAVDVFGPRPAVPAGRGEWSGINFLQELTTRTLTREEIEHGEG